MSRPSERLNQMSKSIFTRTELREVASQVAALEMVSDKASELQVIEPPIYGPGSGHSYFADMMRVTRRYGGGDGGPAAAATRMHHHAGWQHHQNERRASTLAAQAEAAAERALSQSVAEARLYERWRAAGGELFDRRHELRGLSRQDGDGGFFVPPGWLVDQFIHAPRAGAPFAALWSSLPLPPHVSSVNLPRFSPGARTSTQQDDGLPAVSADPADSFIGCPVATIAANIDMPMQWLDQAPLPPDETIGADLAESFATLLDGQLLLGRGAQGQLPGIIPGGLFTAANGVFLSSTNSTAGQSWANGGGATPSITASLHEMTAQLKRKIARFRALPPTHWIGPGSLWDMISGSAADSQNRPLVPPGLHGPAAVPMLHGLPIIADENIPETFGGTTPPMIGPLTGNTTAPTPGNGTWFPLIAGRWKDCLYFQSDPVITIMPEVLSGTLQVRFQARSYVAAFPGRVIFSGTGGTFGGTSQAGGLNNGAPVSYGLVANFTANSPLQPAANGY